MKALRTQVWQLNGSPRPVRKLDRVAAEEPLEIRLDAQPITVTMRTPGDDPELAAGFLLAEGVIRSRADIRAIQPAPRSRKGNTLDVFLNAEVHPNFPRLSRHVLANSSCGLCGKTTIAAVQQHFPPVHSKLHVAASVIGGLPATMRQAQEGFSQTGGLHAAALFTPTGELILVREDVGRHNAVDKVLGWAVLESQLPLDRHVLLVSGRASFEILQKALAARIAIVCAISAPSSLAVSFARRSGQTLVGFLREPRMSVYSHPARLVDTMPG